MIVAVVNDNTGLIHSVLKDFSSRFPHNSYMEAEKIEFVNKVLPNDNLTVKITTREFTQVVDSKNYSFINLKNETKKSS